jgi:hypothetical protein
MNACLKIHPITAKVFSMATDTKHQRPFFDLNVDGFDFDDFLTLDVDGFDLDDGSYDCSGKPCG